MKISQLSGILSLTAFVGTVSAQLISPLNGLDYSTYGISAQGGVVIDIVGTSGAQVVSQISANSLFHGYYSEIMNSIYGIPGAGPSSYIPGSIMGVQAGYTPDLIAALGGGIAQMSIRLTEFDGDTGSASFGPGINMFNPDLDPLAAGIDLIINGFNVANFEDVGFESGVVETDFFMISDAGALSSIFASLSSTGEIVLGYDEGLDKGIASVDFTYGLDDVSLVTSVRPIEVIPEPSVIGLLGFSSIFGLIALRRRR